MPLALMKDRDRVRIISISGSDTVRKHLASLGFVAGAIVTVVQISDGNMILGLNDSRVALNRDTALRIMVQPF